MISPPGQLLGLAEQHVSRDRDLDEDRCPRKQIGMTRKGTNVRLRWEKMERSIQRGRLESTDQTGEKREGLC